MNKFIFLTIFSLIVGCASNEKPRYEQDLTNSIDWENLGGLKGTLQPDNSRLSDRTRSRGADIDDSKIQGLQGSHVEYADKSLRRTPVPRPNYDTPKTVHNNSKQAKDQKYSSSVSAEEPKQSEPSFYEKNKTLINTAATGIVAAIGTYILLSDDEQCFSSDGECSETEEEHHSGLYDALSQRMSGYADRTKEAICRDETTFHKFLKAAGLTVYSAAHALLDIDIGGDGELFGVSDDYVRTSIDRLEMVDTFSKAGLCGS